MGGELEHYTKNSDPFSLLAPEGNSCLPMRQSPGKTTPRRSGALHLILHPRHAPGAGEGDFSHTSLPAASATTSHPTHCHLSPQITPCPKAWRADEAQKTFLGCPDQQPVVAGTSSPHHRRKGLL